MEINRRWSAIMHDAAAVAVANRNSDIVRQNQRGPISSTPNGGSFSGTSRSTGIVFISGKELMAIFDAEFKAVPTGIVFEQGGYIAQGHRGWELYMPSKFVRLKAASDVGRFSDINFGFYGMNRAGEEGLLLKVSERVLTYMEPVLTQGQNISNGKPVLQTKFFTAAEIILHNGESFAGFILKLGHNGDLSNLDEKSLKAMLAGAKYVEPEIDNISGDITDEYKYVPLVLEIEALGSPREILHGQNWRRANRTNKFVHTHLPTESKWNALIRSKINDDRDELNSPTDILGLRHDIARLKAPHGASSSIVTFEYNKRPRILRTFVLELLNPGDSRELLSLATKHRLTLNKHADECTEEELRDIVRFYDLVKKATVNGLPAPQ
jgi:hypothetical protein